MPSSSNSDLRIALQMTAEVAERALTRLVEAEKVVKAAGALRGYIEAAIPFLARELLAELDAYEKSRPS